MLSCVRICNWMFIILFLDRKSTRLNSSHGYISYAVFCLKKKNIQYFEVVEGTPPATLMLVLKYGENREPPISALMHVPTPGLRVYSRNTGISRLLVAVGT